jgi:plasmid stabilization system protein ParE
VDVHVRIANNANARWVTGPPSVVEEIAKSPILGHGDVAVAVGNLRTNFASIGVRYGLAPQAALDLVEIWRYIKEQSSPAIADRVETAIREKFAFLAQTPGAGHRRKDLTDADVQVFPVYSYLIVYRARLTEADGGERERQSQLVVKGLEDRPRK